MGLLINIEAIDRGGKTTQARLVGEALEALGLKVGTMSFPDTPSRSKEATPAHFSTGILIERDLDRNLPLMDGRDSLFRIGELAELSDEAKELIIVNVGEKLVQMLYSINRRERRDALEEALAAHDVVLVGRYLSAYTYGVACGVSRIQLASMEGDLRQPDHTFLLDLDPSVAKERRSDEGYDRYEADTEFQAKVRRLYGELVREDLESAEADGRPARFTRVEAAREPAEITSEIVEGIRSLIGR